MPNEKFQNCYRIPTARARWHDYNGGMYFVTICTKNRNHYFGSINDEKMYMSDIGKYANENLKNISTHYPYAETPLFVVMPNHLHAIICIDGDVAPRVSCKDVARNVSTKKNQKMAEIAKYQSLLAVTIRGFKSAITKYANLNNIEFSWQTRFHDHIIRDINEMNRIADYIENNVTRWDLDCYNNNKK